jgi:aryl-alcohol dehydrogenase-like predicted oxidoreductase
MPMGFPTEKTLKRLGLDFVDLACLKRQDAR